MYRDDHQRRQELATHLSIAADQITTVHKVPPYVEHTFETHASRLTEELRLAWETSWDHLGQARGLVQALGRSISKYDQIRSAAAPDTAMLSDTTAVWIGKNRRANFKKLVTAVELTEAFNALRAEVPDLEVMLEPAPPVDLRERTWLDRVPGGGRTLVAVIVGLVVLALIFL